jgi:hypothetical protein
VDRLIDLVRDRLHFALRAQNGSADAQRGHVVPLDGGAADLAGAGTDVARFWMPVPRAVSCARIAAEFSGALVAGYLEQETADVVPQELMGRMASIAARLGSFGVV